ncbi:hypothetical protein MUN88_06610 [Gracilibacillus caseinilyticus]|uniref:Uncharacterized protein n=1 Tax=Gracilibacillus caseinilyticus TaxID=2932256 RepID=A0ABY4EZB4_9BACI|nr:hypothetical protein [Gracilibacillus caseinilyticus]UOQ49746.1 hypothetical protein MUN88_06610 [Gracilibacillus caseinilyticus]
MIVTSSFQDLHVVKTDLAKLQGDYPNQFTKFINAIKLTRQLQYGFQYMGCLIMGEDAHRFLPQAQTSYVLSIYEREMEKLKKDVDFSEVRQLLWNHKQISYDNICKLALGNKPEFLVGPVLVN